MRHVSVLPKRSTCAGGAADSGYVDELCLAEIVEVLDRYGRLDRFGVVLIEPPFPVSDEEVLVESCDPNTRTLTLRPVTKEDLQGLICVTTRWRMGAEAPEPACVRVSRSAIA
jgi:hypothetical protein